MANVNIKFNNKDYILSCEDDQEDNLKELAKHLDSKYEELKKKLGNIGENKLLLITSIKIVDEYFDLFKKVKHNKSDFEKLSIKFKELRSLAINYKEDKEVEIDNASINANTLGFLTNPKVKAKLASTAKVSSTDSHMILGDPWNALYGYPLAVTTNVPSDLTKGSTNGTCSAMIFGDFSQLIMGMWNTPDVLVDPYTNGNKGTVRIVVLQEIDLAVRHAQSFAACLDYTT